MEMQMRFQPFSSALVSLELPPGGLPARKRSASEATTRSTSRRRPSSRSSHINHAPNPNVPVHMADCQLPPQGLPSVHLQVPERWVETAYRIAPVALRTSSRLS